MLCNLHGSERCTPFSDTYTIVREGWSGLQGGAAHDSAGMISEWEAPPEVCEAQAVGLKPKHLKTDKFSVTDSLSDPTGPVEGSTSQKRFTGLQKNSKTLCF